MTCNFKPNPYCGFKDDCERRRALNVRAVSYAVAAVALATIDVDWQTRITWFARLFH
jgi:hypothetical protein